MVQCVCAVVHYLISKAKLLKGCGDGDGGDCRWQKGLTSALEERLIECASWTGKYTGKAAVLIADADQV